MNAAAPPVTPAGPGELDALLSAISEAVNALANWNFPAFQAAIERQCAICDRLELTSEWRQHPGAAATARRVQELNCIYDRLLQHSVRWTRTIHSMLQASGHPYARSASVHFRG